MPKLLRLLRLLKIKNKNKITMKVMWLKIKMLMNYSLDKITNIFLLNLATKQALNYNRYV